MFDFSYNEYQRFMERCPFTDEEIEILNMKRRGKSNVHISVKLHMLDIVNILSFFIGIPRSSFLYCKYCKFVV